MLDAILDLTAFRYSDFGRFLVCYSPPETVPETVKKPLLAIVGGSTLFCRISTRLNWGPRSTVNINGEKVFGEGLLPDIRVGCGH